MLRTATFEKYQTTIKVCCRRCCCGRIILGLSIPLSLAVSSCLRSSSSSWCQMLEVLLRVIKCPCGCLCTHTHMCTLMSHTCSCVPQGCGHTLSFSFPACSCVCVHIMTSWTKSKQSVGSNFRYTSDPLTNPLPGQLARCYLLRRRLFHASTGGGTVLFAYLLLHCSVVAAAY